MARSAENQPQDADQDPQPNKPSDSPQARDAAAKAAADEQAQKDAKGAAVQERDVQPSEPVTTTTDNEGNQVVLPTSHTGDQQIINGPGEDFNPARPGVSAEWAAARTNDEEHDPTQNDGLTTEEAQRQAQEENVQDPSQPAHDEGQNPPETASQP